MLLRPRAACGRRRGVRPTSHFEGTLGAHVEGGSGRSEASPTAILQDTHSVEGVFYEIRLSGILGRALRAVCRGNESVYNPLSPSRRPKEEPCRKPYPPAF